MISVRRVIAIAMIAATTWLGAVAPSSAGPHDERANEALHAWYGLVLELVRHTATYSPPVASRAFAYLGITAYETAASGESDLVTLAGQVNGLGPVPRREEGAVYDEAVALNAALAFTAGDLFSNTGPTGQRALSAMARKWAERVAEGVSPEIRTRSQSYGEAVARHVLSWSREDGRATIENLGFPRDYELGEAPSNWVPTNLIPLQQVPLLPDWGRTRTFATPNGQACPVPPYPGYSEDMASAFHAEAREVYEAARTLTPEQRAIARFWSDDPMLSPTPPGHWISIVLQVQDGLAAPLDARVEALALLGITLADAFIACWDAKFKYDLVRPVTYIRRHIDPKWETVLITPPFPEYPSGHSTQSGAAAVVLTRLFGEHFAFTDDTHAAEGLPARSFASFQEAAEEAGISRLYGGIHYRAAIVNGLAQGHCIGAYTLALTTRKNR